MVEKLTKSNLIFSDTNNEKKRKFIEHKLFEFNQAQSKQVVECDRLQPDSPTFIEIYAEVELQKIIGGLISYIDWGRWLYIDIIWVDADYRNQGIGKYLVISAEQKAKNNAVKRVRLCTFDFQALPFYQKLGYTIYGQLEDFPEGHTLYYLRKNLT